MDESKETLESIPIAVREMTMKFGSRVIQQNLTFDVHRGETFIIMGGSGCGKSTLMRHLVGLIKPYSGTIYRKGVDFWGGTEEDRDRIRHNTGIMYQAGGLWSSMTLLENTSYPLQAFTDLKEREIEEVARLKLALVGLSGFEGLYPSEISGGMLKRASLARAMALDPEVLFFDEPSAGLDPISARRLDELIIELRESLKTTIVVVTHDLESLFLIGTDSVFLDEEMKCIRAKGNPTTMLETTKDEKIIRFLTRGRRTGQEQ